ncbi:toxin-antitoxin system TumE family protein [Rhizobium sp. SAFR-030]|uniref:toxin-antitoxin system TumE family protein n=1 Tax=Rhizobium sp. SAFR-030 TaxID=3387277 RepID=UPI003F7D03E4
MANMDADLLYRTKAVLSDGAIIEMVVWRLPSPVLGSSHLFKYSLFYGFKGQRIVGYDNERGKGDHRHIDSRQEAYHFSTVDALISDFLDDIRKRRSRR